MTIEWVEIFGLIGQGGEWLRKMEKDISRGCGEGVRIRRFLDNLKAWEVFFFFFPFVYSPPSASWDPNVTCNSFADLNLKRWLQATISCSLLPSVPDCSWLGYLRDEGRKAGRKGVIWVRGCKCNSVETAALWKGFLLFFTTIPVTVWSGAVRVPVWNVWTTVMWFSLSTPLLNWPRDKQTMEISPL